ncbi:MAG: hypothetical protein L3J71_07730 [Victivallaceae bacterium]|nr:hypothetical protein [Victivallaceae bacterium]
MKLYIIAGFLGSGKTSILLPLAKAFSAAGKKLAIIENEVGKVGIDDLVLREDGMEVREIYSGCVCCSLRLDLITTLINLEHDFAPDVVLMEPSGVASPRQVVNALLGYGGEIDFIKVITVIDAERFAKLDDLSLPIINDGINVADIIVINKIDLIEKNAIAQLEARLHKTKPDIEFRHISALNNIGIAELAETLIAESEQDYHDNHHPEPETVANDKGEPPVVYAAEQTIIPIPDDIESMIKRQLQQLANKLNANNCKVIGHIKAILKSSGGGFMLFSTTGTDRQPNVKGKLPANATEATLKLNIIVYGISKDKLTELAETSFPLGLTQK